jgi:DNA-binding transcriptional MerR regulator
MTEKSPDAFRTISEVAQDLDLPQHVLRFWETRFSQIKPLKRGGGRRYYRPDDIDLLKGIRQLLYGEGYTIRGVQRILKEDGVRFVQSIGRGEQSVEAASPGAQEEPSAPGDELERGDPAGRAEPRQEPREARVSPGPALESGPGPSGTAALSISDVGRLRLALEELLECERMLNALNASEPDGDPSAQNERA